MFKLLTRLRFLIFILCECVIKIKILLLEELTKENSIDMFDTFPYTFTIPCLLYVLFAPEWYP